MKKTRLSVLLWICIVIGCHSQKEQPNDIIKRLNEIKDSKSTSNLDVLFDSIGFTMRIDDKLTDSISNYTHKVDTADDIFFIDKKRKAYGLVTSNGKYYIEALKGLKARNYKETESSTVNKIVYTTFESDSLWFNLIKGIYSDKLTFSIILQKK